MPMNSPKPPKMKAPPAPPAFSLDDLTPEQLAALETEIPPMEDNPYAPRGRQPQPGMVPGEYDVPGWGAANPGASSSGGPSTPQSGIRSDIFRTLYRQGKRSGNDALMNIGRPPMMERPPLEMPVPPWEQETEEPFYLETPKGLEAPPREQWPIHLQGPPEPSGMSKNPGFARFPRANSLMSGARTMKRGR